MAGTAPAEAKRGDRTLNSMIVEYAGLDRGRSDLRRVEHCKKGRVANELSVGRIYFGHWCDRQGEVRFPSKLLPHALACK